MVFVSANGFQSGALTQAKKFGIDILTAEQVSVEYLAELMPNISQYQLEISKTDFDHRITIGSYKITTPEKIKLSYKNEIIEYASGKKFHIGDLIKMTIEVCLQVVDKEALKHYVNHKDTLEQNPSFPLTLALDIPKMRFYFTDENLNKLDLIKLEFEVDVIFHKIISKNSGRVIKSIDNLIKAHSIVFKIDENTESELILKPDNNFSFYHTKDKETVEFKTLSIYDAKTNQITSS